MLSGDYQKHMKYWQQLSRQVINVLHYFSTNLLVHMTELAMLMRRKEFVQSKSRPLLGGSFMTLSRPSQDIPCPADLESIKWCLLMATKILKNTFPDHHQSLSTFLEPLAPTYERMGNSAKCARNSWEVWWKDFSTRQRLKLAKC